jgi:hypothetical protein
VHLALPEPCEAVFEAVLAYMYDERARRESSSMTEGLAPDRALGALWLAGRLEMARLKAQLVRHLERAVTPANAHLYLSAALALGLTKAAAAAAARMAAASLDSLPRGACDALPLDAVERLLATAAGAAAGAAAGSTAAGRDRVLASYLRARDAAGRLDEESYRRLTRRPSVAGGGGGGGGGDDGASGAGGDANDGDDDGDDGDDDGDGGEGDEGGVEAGDAVLLLELALRFGDAAPARRRRLARRAARGFAGLRAEDLARLPARAVADLLGDDALAAGDEDEVHAAAAAYLAAREARGGAAAAPTAEERAAVWGCCRFAYCSAGVQAELERVAEEEGGGLMREFLRGVTARMRREGGEAGQREVARGLGAAAAASAQARARRKAAGAQVCGFC